MSVFSHRHCSQRGNFHARDYLRTPASCKIGLGLEGATLLCVVGYLESYRDDARCARRTSEWLFQEVSNHAEEGVHVGDRFGAIRRKARFQETLAVALPGMRC